MRKSSKLTILLIILFICLVGSSLYALYIIELTKHNAEAVSKMNHFNILYFSLFFNLMLVVFIIIAIKRDVRDQLEFLANHDTLTGIYNQSYFHRAFHYEITRANRYKEDLCLVLFDIDFFKNVNDQYGHDIGDCVLRSMAKLIQKSIRTTDIFSRVGGEEFAIIVPKTNIDHAIYLAEKVRTLVETYDFPSVGRLTISLGVSQLEPGDTTGHLFKRADIALYKAKYNGRNRTEASYGKIVNTWI